MVLADYADHVTLVDPSRQQLELSRSFLASRPAIDRRQMAATHLAFPDASMDLVTMIRVMHHLPEPAAELAEVARILRADGYAIIEAANSAHARNRVRYQLRREQIPLSAVSIGSRGRIPYVNHHPDTVARQVRLGCAGHPDGGCGPVRAHDSGAAAGGPGGTAAGLLVHAHG